MDKCVAVEDDGEGLGGMRWDGFRYDPRDWTAHAHTTKPRRVFRKISPYAG